MSEYVLDTSLTRETWEALDAFAQGYVEAAMWTLTDEDGHSLDYLGLHDIAPETIARAVEDCAAFVAAHRADLDEATDEDKRRTDASHGHDFWLTRNGHGCGFWDRGYSEPLGQHLTDSAHAYGEVDWYLGDDGLVYQS